MESTDNFLFRYLSTATQTASVTRPTAMNTGISTAPITAYRRLISLRPVCVLSLGMAVVLLLKLLALFDGDDGVSDASVFDSPFISRSVGGNVGTDVGRGAMLLVTVVVAVLAITGHGG